MAYAAVKFLQETLSHLSRIKFDLNPGAREELKLLESDVALLEAFVKQDPVEGDFGQGEELERKIMDAVHEVEDAIDTFLSKGGGDPDQANQLTQVVRSFRKEKLTQDLFFQIERFHKFFGEGSLYRTKVKKVPFAKNPSLWQQDSSNIDVGLGDGEDPLMCYLMEQIDKLGVITLLGDPGIGKTTLAWSVYWSQKIQYEFPTRIWLDMSQGFDEKDRFLNILKQLSSDLSSISSSSSYQQLLKTIWAYLEEGKFLLVIDDVLSVRNWKAISKIFPRQNRMCKVLITTSSNKVSSHARRMTKRDPYCVRGLSESESWTLLQSKVYGMFVAGCTPAIKDTGESIARKCQGVPLMIVLIAEFLRAQLAVIEQNNVDAAIAEWVEMEKRISIFCVKSFEERISDCARLVYRTLPRELS